jgi:hypothetical protein
MKMGENVFRVLILAERSYQLSGKLVCTYIMHVCMCVGRER